MFSSSKRWDTTNLIAFVSFKFKNSTLMMSTFDNMRLKHFFVFFFYFRNSINSVFITVKWLFCSMQSWFRIFANSLKIGIKFFSNLTFSFNKYWNIWMSSPSMPHSSTIGNFSYLSCSCMVFFYFSALIVTTFLYMFFHLL